MHISDELLREVVTAMPTEFDSHALIEHVMREEPQGYVRHLYYFVDKPDPIQQGHAAIGRRLATFTDIIVKTDRPESPTVRGTSNENQGWRKK